MNHSPRTARPGAVRPEHARRWRDGGRRRAAEFSVVVLTVKESERDLLDVVAARAVGYLLKPTRSDDLRLAHAEPRRAKGRVFSPQLAALLIGRVPPPGHHRRRRITAAERTLGAQGAFAHVARGESYRTVGGALFISPKTVENHVRNAMARLHLSRRHEADPAGPSTTASRDHPASPPRPHPPQAPPWPPPPPAAFS